MTSQGPVLSPAVAGHSHRADTSIDGAVRLGGAARSGLLGFLGLCLVATVVGLVVWWPPGGVTEHVADQAGQGAQFAAPGVTFPVGTVESVGSPCTDGVPDGSGCGSLRVKVPAEDGAPARTVEVQVSPDVLAAGLERGDRVELVRTPHVEGGSDGASYAFFGIKRGGTLAWLAVVFAAVVLAVARWRGLFALIGLAFGGAVVWWFLLPALFDGAPGVGVALVSSSAIMMVVLYLTHGVSYRTSVALAGTLIGITLTALMGLVAIGHAHLTGISDEAGAMLASFDADLDFQSLLSCALVIAGLGVLNDVTITQASAAWELRALSPGATRAQVFASAMRIGRDHIASTIYTIVFAYVGTALVVLMLISIYDRPLLELLSTAQLAEEVVRTLVTSIGLVLAVPITTAVAAAVAAPVPGAERPDEMPLPAHAH